MFFCYYSTWLQFEIKRYYDIFVFITSYKLMALYTGITMTYTSQKLDHN